MSDPRKNARDVYPPTGPEITAKSWLTEAPMRMLMNNLHPDVAENPHELVVYGGIGRAARPIPPYTTSSAGFSATSGSRLFISIRSGASVSHDLADSELPRGARIVRSSSRRMISVRAR